MLPLPFEYRIEQEYLLKKKIENGFEAIALQAQMSPQEKEDLSIEPFFYARSTLEEAIKKSAYQIQKDEGHILLNTKKQFQVILKSLLKQESTKGFQFEDCKFSLHQAKKMAIRMLGSEHVEVLIDGIKKVYPVNQKIECQGFSFFIKEPPLQKYTWMTYKIYPFEKSFKRAKSRLKIYAEKKSKSVLNFRFFNQDKIQGENFLYTLISVGNKKAEQIKKDKITLEIEGIENKLLALEQENIFPTSKEGLSFYKIALEEKIERKKNYLKELNYLEESINYLNYLIQEKKIIDEFSKKELKELIKKKAFLNPPFKLERAVNRPIEAIEGEIRQRDQSITLQDQLIEKLTFIEQEKNRSNFVFTEFSQALNALFGKKRELENELKFKAVSEMQENGKQIKKFDELIDYEIQKSIQEAFDIKAKERKEMDRLLAELYSRIENEILFLEKDYFMQLEIKKEVEKKKLALLKQQLFDCEKELVFEKEKYETILLQIEKSISVSLQKEELKNKLLKKLIQRDSTKFFGQILSSPKADPFPLILFRVFIILFFSLLLLSLFLFYSIIQRSQQGIFPSNFLFNALNVKRMTLKQFKGTIGKKIVVTEKNTAYLLKFNLPIKRKKELKDEDHQDFKWVGIDEELLSFEEIQKLIEKHPNVSFVKSTIF